MSSETILTQAISETLYKYCRSLDRMDRAMYDNLFVPDAPMDYGAHFRGTAAGFADWVWIAHEAMQSHSHQIANILVEAGTDGATAGSESYVTVCLRTKPDRSGNVVDIVDRGRYIDRWSRQTDGSWRISARVFVSDIQQVLDASRSPQTTVRRDRTDPSYGVFP